MDQINWGIHKRMLSDQARNQALEAAIHTLVQPNDCIIDIGTGTGLLAMMAVKAGARKVYAIERNSFFATLAAKIIQENGMADNIEVIHCHSLEWNAPEKADGLICETLGFLGIDERFRLSCIDARQRFLKKEAWILPGEVGIVACLSELPNELASSIELNRLHGFNYQSAKEAFDLSMHRTHLPLEKELSERQVVLQLNSNEMSLKDPLSFQRHFQLTREGRIGGLLCWFQATLADKIWLDNRRPTSENHWGQAFLPFKTPILGKPKEMFEVHVAIRDLPTRFSLNWSVSPCISLVQ